MAVKILMRKITGKYYELWNGNSRTLRTLSRKVTLNRRSIFFYLKYNSGAYRNVVKRLKLKKT